MLAKLLKPQLNYFTEENIWMGIVRPNAEGDAITANEESNRPRSTNQPEAVV